MRYHLPPCFGQFIFKVTFSCTLSVSVSVLYFHTTASPVGTQGLLAISFSGSVNFSHTAVPREMKNYFTGSSMEEKLANTCQHNKNDPPLRSPETFSI